MKDLAACLESLDRFTAGSLTRTLRDIQDHLHKADSTSCADINATLRVDAELLDAAATVKRAAAQIDVVIHAVGILHLLPIILSPDERVLSLSLGAGNTGKRFDLETTRQIGEFTFIAWRGGSEAIRQNKLFVDFMHLVEADTTKQRYLYLLDRAMPDRFFRSRRKIESVLMNRPAERDLIRARYSNPGMVVSDYFWEHHTAVEIIDVQPHMPASLLAAVELAAEQKND